MIPDPSAPGKIAVVDKLPAVSLMNPDPIMRSSAPPAIPNPAVLRSACASVSPASSVVVGSSVIVITCASVVTPPSVTVAVLFVMIALSMSSAVRARKSLSAPPVVPLSPFISQVSFDQSIRSFTESFRPTPNSATVKSVPVSVITPEE